MTEKAIFVILVWKNMNAEKKCICRLLILQDQEFAVIRAAFMINQVIALYN